MFFQRRHIDSQHTHEKMLNITNHWGNANKTTVKCHLIPVTVANINYTRHNKWRRECGTKEPHVVLAGL